MQLPKVFDHPSATLRALQARKYTKVLEWLNLISSLYSFLYSVLLAVGMLASLPYWLFQMARHGKYRKGLAERLGRVPARLQLPGRQEPILWVHAVSVGEVLAVAGLVDELRRR